MDRKGFENESNSSSQLDLQNFKQGVAFPFEKLQEIVYNDNKYTSTIIGFIRQGYKKIKREELEYALIYFTQAEKMLEYGASCGRIIDRNLIVCVLHNQSCCYQKLNELSKGAKYLEAIIYNIRAHLKSIEVCPSTSDVIESALLKNIPQFNRVSWRKKLQLAQYHLQFCSVHSQMKARKTALEAAKAAIQLYKTFFNELKIANNLFNHTMNVDGQKIANSIKQYKTFKEDMALDAVDDYLKLTKYYLKKWRSLIKFGSKTLIDKMLKNYSIGDFVELQVLQYNEYYTENAFKFQCDEVVKQLLHFSMGHFQLATQYRLIAEETYKIDNASKENSEEYKLAHLNHMLAIIIIALYVPYDMIFMGQIVSSYQHHFKHSLDDIISEHYKPKLSLLFSLQVQKKICLKKRKISDLRTRSKKKVLGFGLTHRKQSLNGKKHKLDNPRTVKEEYFVDGFERQRNRRLSSNQSKKSSKGMKKRVQSAESLQVGYMRERMRTRNGDADKGKKKERAIEQYCAFPIKGKQVKKSLQKNIMVKCIRKSSLLNSDEKYSVQRKTSAERSFSNKQKLIESGEEQLKKKATSQQKPKLGQCKGKRKATVKKYYL